MPTRGPHVHERNAAPLFTRIPFSIDPLCARSGVVRWSRFPSLLGLFIRLPVTTVLFKAPPDFSSSLPLSFSPSSPPLSPVDPTFVFLSILVHLSCFQKLFPLAPLRSSPFFLFSLPPTLFLQQPDARQGRLYVLPSLSVARLACRFSIYFRISPRATRCNLPSRSLSLSLSLPRNVIRSNRNSRSAVTDPIPVSAHASHPWYLHGVKSSAGIRPDAPYHSSLAQFEMNEEPCRWIVNCGNNKSRR